MSIKSSTLLRVVILFIVVLSMAGCSSPKKPQATVPQNEPSPTVGNPAPDSVPIPPTTAPSPTPSVVPTAIPTVVPTAVVAAASPTAVPTAVVPAGPTRTVPPVAELPEDAPKVTILHTNDVRGYVDPCG